MLTDAQKLMILNGLSMALSVTESMANFGFKSNEDKMTSLKMVIRPMLDVLEEEHGVNKTEAIAYINERFKEHQKEGRVTMGEEEEK